MIAILALTLAAYAEERPVDSSALGEALASELERNQAKLSLPEAPPIYHLRYHLMQMDQVDVHATLGSLVSYGADPFNALGVELRVGEPGYDNTGFGGWQNGFDRLGLPAVLTPSALQIEAWRLTDRAYKQAIEQYARKRAQFTAPPEYPGDYSLTGPTSVDGASGRLGDADALRDLALAVSGALTGGPRTLERGSVYVGHEAGSVWTVDTEGSSVHRPVQETTIRAVAHLRTADGMLLSDHRLWTVPHPDDLPEREAMLAEAGKLRDSLQDLADAPVLEDEYVGPVIFEDSAAVDLFRYILIPQLEGTPPEIPFDSWFGDLGNAKSAVRLGRRVLPPGWQVTDDPTLDPSHPGSFTHDWEGTPAVAVQCVDDGIVRDLLMSRVPRKDMAGTNGHGRGFLGGRAEGRASLTTVEPAKRVSSAKLRKMAFKVARAYGRDWIVAVRRLQEPAVRNASGGGGFMLFGGGEESAQLPPPVSIVKIYADGREETLRGAGFASVERWVLRDVMAAGPQVSASYLAPASGGSYGSLSPTEGMPSWISAPEVLVGEVELVPMPGDPTEVPVLQPPPL